MVQVTAQLPANGLRDAAGKAVAHDGAASPACGNPQHTHAKEKDPLHISVFYSLIHNGRHERRLKQIRHSLHG